MTAEAWWFQIIKAVVLFALLYFACLNVATAKCGKCGSQHQVMKTTTKSVVKTMESYEVPDARVITADGDVTTLTEVLATDKTIMMNFIFTSCSSICPIMSGIFSQVSAKLENSKEDLLMVSVSIDPEHDSPKKLRQYAEKFNAGSNWIFLTGDLTDIEFVQKSFKAYRGNKMNHEPVTFIRKNNSSDWIRMEGFASASDLVDEYHIPSTE